jgi:uncharacterized protein YkwD
MTPSALSPMIAPRFRPRAFAVVATLVLAAAATGCGHGSGGASGDSPNEASADDQRFALADLNRHRAEHGAPALALSAALTQFAANGSADLAATNTAHAYFAAHGSDVGCLRAENQAPGWPGTIQDVIRKSNQAMMDEGPGGGHYENIINRRHTHVGIGVYSEGNRHYVTTDFGVGCPD